MIHKSSLCKFFATLSMSVLVFATAWSLPSYEVFQPTPQYLEAEGLLERIGSRQAGVEKLLVIARANPGTTLGATCLFKAAHYVDSRATAKSLYAEISRNYPGTAFDVHARDFLYTVDHSMDEGPVALQGIEQLLRSLRVPVLPDILRSPTQSLQHLRRLDPSFVEAVGYLYETYAKVLVDVGRYDEAIKFATFGRSLFPDNGLGVKFQYHVQAAFKRKYKLPQYISTLAPVYLKLQVSEQQRICSRPLIRGDVYTGDYQAKPVDWQDSIVTLDGVNIKAKLNLVFSYPKKPKLGKVFEVVQFIYQPSVPLTPGRHVLYLKLMTSSKTEGPVAEQTRTFYVDRSIRDDRDDDDDEQDRRRSHERDD